MLKDTTYKEKFAMLKNWMPLIIESVKKDLKGDHLKKDYAFVKKYFNGKNINKISVVELAQGYQNALEQEEKIEELGEFITNRWLLNNAEVYHFFEEKLRQITPNFTELSVLDLKDSRVLVDGSIHLFGAVKTYLFSILNSVVFPTEIFDELSQRAQEVVNRQEEEASAIATQQSIENLHKHFTQHIARLTDKYEKKIQGLQKKYLHDIELLKKQVANLQRKLNGQ